MNQKRILGNKQVEEGNHKGKQKQEDEDRYRPLSNYKFNQIKKECKEANGRNKQVEEENHESKKKITSRRRKSQVEEENHESKKKITSRSQLCSAKIQVEIVIK